MVRRLPPRPILETVAVRDGPVVNVIPQRLRHLRPIHVERGDIDRMQRKFHGLALAKGASHREAAGGYQRHARWRCGVIRRHPEAHIGRELPVPIRPRVPGDLLARPPRHARPQRPRETRRRQRVARPAIGGHRHRHRQRGAIRVRHVVGDVHQLRARPLLGAHVGNSGAGSVDRGARGQQGQQGKGSHGSDLQWWIRVVSIDRPAFPGGLAAPPRPAFGP